MSKKLIALFMILIVLLMACQTQSEAEPTPVAAVVTEAPTRLPATATPVPPTETPEPTPTETTVPTELPPTETPEPSGRLNYVAYYGGQPAGNWDLSNFQTYKEAHPGLETDYYGSSIYSAPVPRPIHSRITREETADVFGSFIVGALYPHIEQGYIMDISDLWAEQGWDAVFPERLKAYVSVDGRQYFVPQAFQWNPIWYRTDIFAEVGIDVPQSWEEFLTACDTLHEAGYVPVTVSSLNWTPPVARWFTLLNLRLNGAEFHEALMRGEESYADPRVRAVFEHWQEMFAHNCFGQRVGYGEAADQIYNGEAAMYNLGEWLAESYPNGMPDTMDFFSFPVMNPDVPHAEIVHLYGAFIHANTPNEAIARDYLAYLGSVESQTSNVEALNRVVANQQVDQSLYSDVYQKSFEFLQNAEQITQLYELNTDPAMAETGLRAFTDFFQSPTDETIDEVLADLEAKRVRVYGE